MRKIFIVLSLLVAGYSLASAQITAPLPGAELLAQEIAKLIPMQDIKNRLYVTERLINNEYQTIEQNKLPMTAEEYNDFYLKQPVILEPEQQVTPNYKQAIINIPSNYLLYDVGIAVNKNSGKPYLYLADDSVLMESNGQDISFKLDYEIHFLNSSDKEEFLKLGHDFNLNNRQFRVYIKYSPKYFTLKKLNNYNQEKQVNIVYRNKNITLNTITKPVLYLEDEKGNPVEFVLEPNFQNLYTDFKFVREGHKKVKFIDIQ